MARGIGGRIPGYHGWYVVGTCVVVSMVLVGARNSFGAFVLPMSEEFGWNRGTVSLAAFLGLLLNGVTQTALGVVSDRAGGRRTILFSLIILGLATLALSLTFHIVFLVLVLGVVSGVATSGASPAITSALLTNWFRRARSTALGINAAGAALGGLLLVPLAILVIEVADWRMAWVSLAMLVLLLAVPLVYALVYDGPALLGLNPDGDAAPDEPGPSRQAPREETSPQTWGWRDALRSPPIWNMSGGYFTDGFSTAILLVHFVPYASSQGASPAMAASLFSLMMVMSIVGSVTAGLGSDRADSKTVLALIYALRGGGYAVALLLPGDVGLWAAAVGIGFSWNAPASLTTTLLANIYGLASLGSLSGLTYSFRQIGGAVGVLLAGYLFDATGSYSLPFAITGGLMLPAAAAVFAINQQKYALEGQVGTEE